MTINIASYQRSPLQTRQRPRPFKLNSMPNLNRAVHMQPSVEPFEDGSTIRRKIRRGMCNVRSYIRTQIHHSDALSNPCTESPPISSSDSLTVSNVAKYNHYEDLQVPKTGLSSLRRKLSTRVLGTLNPGTVIVKPELRRPASIQSLLSLQSSGGMSPLRLVETPPTSEGTLNTSSPGSLRRLDVVPSTINRDEVDSGAASNNYLPLLDRAAIRKLSTIPEVDKQQIAKIKTIENTAAAKVYLETHYSKVLTPKSMRQARQEEFEHRLMSMRLPPYLKHRIRRVYERSNSDVLRKTRILATNESRVKAYHVVRVLGKGSFGVVRLVRDKEILCCAESALVTPIECPVTYVDSRKTSMATMTQGFSQFKGRTLPQNKGIFAMKVIRKAGMLRNAQEGHLRAERNLLVTAEGSKWIVNLITAFQDHKHLYLVMDFCVGGDFLGLLIRKNILSEQITKWYVAEMILCVEEAHRMEWIHRDVKPDNFLIGADGHLKISDFGLSFDGNWEHDQKYFNRQRHNLVSHLDLELEGDTEDQREAERRLRRTGSCKKYDDTGPTLAEEKACAHENEKLIDWRNKSQRRKLARSVVGTSQYMAPEVIRGELYDGYTPFACEDRHTTKLKILAHAETLKFPQPLEFPQPVTSEALDLIIRLLVEKETRLCTRRYQLNDYAQRLTATGTKVFHADKNHRDYRGFFVQADDTEELKAHPFFTGIPWNTMRQFIPPFVPRVMSWEDTKYFEEEGPVSDIDDDTSEDESEPLLLDDCPPRPCEHQQEDQGIVPEAPAHDLIAKITTLVKSKRKDEKKRPRDKILRDPVCSKTAMKVRKEKAFAGYGYHAPRPLSEIINEALAEEGVSSERDCVADGYQWA